MTEYNVSLSDDSYSISLDSPTSFSVSNVSIGATAVPAKFSDLSDFDGQTVSDKFVIMYNASTQTYETVNPDEVFSAAISEPSSPGLSTSFITQMATDLDNEVSLDGGGF